MTTRPVKVKAAITLLSMLFTAWDPGSHAPWHCLGGSLVSSLEVCIMLCFSIALSSVVTDLAVTPLERMLGTASAAVMRAGSVYTDCRDMHERTVREIAATVFRFSPTPRVACVHETSASST